MCALVVFNHCVWAAWSGAASIATQAWCRGWIWPTEVWGSRHARQSGEPTLNLCCCRPGRLRRRRLHRHNHHRQLRRMWTGVPARCGRLRWQLVPVPRRWVLPRVDGNACLLVRGTSPCPPDAVGCDGTVCLCLEGGLGPLPCAWYGALPSYGTLRPSAMRTAPHRSVAVWRRLGPHCMGMC